MTKPDDEIPSSEIPDAEIIEELLDQYEEAMEQGRRLSLIHI